MLFEKRIKVKFITTLAVSLETTVEKYIAFVKLSTSKSLGPKTHHVSIIDHFIIYDCLRKYFSFDYIN